MAAPKAATRATYAHGRYPARLAAAATSSRPGVTAGRAAPTT